MRLLVCGSREWGDEDTFNDEFQPLLEELDPWVVIHGACRGPDLWAAAAVTLMNAWPDEVALLPFPVDHLRDGPWPAAGPRRNARMLQVGGPDLVLAFWDGTSRGTLSMIQLAVKAGVPVRIVPEQRR